MSPARRLAVETRFGVFASRPVERPVFVSHWTPRNAARRDFAVDRNHGSMESGCGRGKGEGSAAPKARAPERRSRSRAPQPRNLSSRRYG